MLLLNQNIHGRSKEHIVDHIDNPRKMLKYYFKMEKLLHALGRGKLAILYYFCARLLDYDGAKLKLSVNMAFLSF